MSDDITPYEDRLAAAKKLDGEITWAWETWVDSFEDLDEFIDSGLYTELGYESGLTYVRDRLLPITDKAKLMANYRQPLIQILLDAGFSNRSIAGAIGLSEATVRRDRKELEGELGGDAEGVRRGDAPNDVDAAGQSVEEVGHIDDNEPPLQIDADPTPPVVEEVQQVETNNDDDDDEQRRRMEEWMNSLSLERMIIDVPPHIMGTGDVPEKPDILTEMNRKGHFQGYEESIAANIPSPTTGDYFQPRQAAPSWSPPQVGELPPPRPKAYDSIQGDFVEPALTLPKSAEPNKADEHVKHCKTCACNLLP